MGRVRRGVGRWNGEKGFVGENSHVETKGGRGRREVWVCEEKVKKGDEEFS